MRDNECAKMANLDDLYVEKRKEKASREVESWVRVAWVRSFVSSCTKREASVDERHGSVGFSLRTDQTLAEARRGREEGTTIAAGSP